MCEAIDILDAPLLTDVFVLKSDLHRLAAVYLLGGWWLDADIWCLDPIYSTLDGPVGSAIEDALRVHQRGASSSGGLEVGSRCIFAWEGEITAPPSAPLQWAFGCTPKHPFIKGIVEHPPSVTIPSVPYY